MLSARLGGEITVESVENEGSTFTFYIETKPVQPSDGDISQLKSISSSQVQMKASVNGLLTNKPEKRKNLNKTLSESSPSASITRSIKDAKTSKSTTTSSKPKYHLLVVEDNIINQKIM